MGRENVLFREDQQFRQKWLWVLMAGMALLEFAVFGGGFYQQFVQGRPWGSSPMSNSGLLMAALLGLTVPSSVIALLVVARLETEVTEEGLRTRFFPFHLKERRFAREEIASHEPVTYRPIPDYGGWGIRFGRQDKAWTVSGNRGVRLTLASGSRLLIGSQQAEEFDAALTKVQRG